MVFAGVFPLDATDFTKLEEAIGRVSRKFPLKAYLPADLYPQLARYTWNRS
jgi:hypothetical protein